MTIKKVATTTAILAAGTSTAFASGLDRVTFSSNILYEEGTYAEATYGLTTPKVSSSSFPSSLSGGSVAKSFTTVKLGFKADITDKFAIAVTYNNQPVGADINYGPLVGISGVVDGQNINVLGKYQFSDRISAYAGVKYQYLSGSINVPGIAIVASGEGEYGAIAGAAYEIPDIKLRVALSFESKIDYTLASTVATALPVPPTGTSTASTPEAWILEFRSGVAANTLVFGSVRYSKWADAQISVPVLGVITNNTNVTTYELGVAYRFNEKFVGFTAFGFEKSDDIPQSGFAPTDGQFDISVGGQLDIGKGFKVASSIKYSKRGDAIINPATAGIGGNTFDDNSVLTVGIKLSKSF